MSGPGPNRWVDGVECAPEGCIVCGSMVGMKGTYLAGAKPMGAVACLGKCTEVAIERHKKTGRVDVPMGKA